MLLHQVARKLYLFLARDEIRELPQLGKLGPVLTELVVSDLDYMYSFIKEKDWKN